LVTRIIHQYFQNGEAAVRAYSRGLDPDSRWRSRPELLATDRTARVTYVVHGWKVTDPATRADTGSVPERAILFEIPEDMVRMYVRQYQQRSADVAYPARPGYP
jgi:hypothetical protein